MYCVICEDNNLSSLEYIIFYVIFNDLKFLNVDYLLRLNFDEKFLIYVKKFNEKNQIASIFTN